MMEVEWQGAIGVAADENDEVVEEMEMKKSLKGMSVVSINYMMMVIGMVGGPLLLRLYFLKGGKRIWFSSCLQTAAWPLTLIPLLLSYYLPSGRNRNSRMFLMSRSPSLFLCCASIGLIIGLDDWLYAYGLSYLPLSTSSILISTQLAFTALFAFVLVRQSFTAYSVNAVVLLITGAVMLGINSNGDRPKGESKRQYYVGFCLTLGAAALYGLVLALVELSQIKYYEKNTYSYSYSYTLVMEMQLVMGFFATAFTTVGMIVNNDFTAIAAEAGEFGLGESRYYIVVMGCAILFQCFFLGTVGAIFYGSALLAGIVMAVLIPIGEVLAVAFYSEPFSSGKGVALGLSLWGFASYLYGELKANNKKPSSTQNHIVNANATASASA